jgi:hypothetical protein
MNSFTSNNFGLSSKMNVEPIKMMKMSFDLFFFFKIHNLSIIIFGCLRDFFFYGSNGPFNLDQVSIDLINLLQSKKKNACKVPNNFFVCFFFVNITYPNFFIIGNL